MDNTLVFNRLQMAVRVANWDNLTRWAGQEGRKEAKWVKIMGGRKGNCRRDKMAQGPSTAGLLKSRFSLAKLIEEDFRPPSILLRGGLRP